MDFLERPFGEPEPSLGSSVVLLALGVVSSLIWAAVGVPLAIWNLTDPGQPASGSAVSDALLAAMVIANLAPFALGGLALIGARSRRGLSWARSLRTAAPWVGIASGASFVLTAVATGGMP